MPIPQQPLTTTRPTIKATRFATPIQTSANIPTSVVPTVSQTTAQQTPPVQLVTSSSSGPSTVPSQPSGSSVQSPVKTTPMDTTPVDYALPRPTWLKSDANPAPTPANTPATSQNINVQAREASGQGTASSHVVRGPAERPQVDRIRTQRRYKPYSSLPQRFAEEETETASGIKSAM